ncbi:hypothetical protein N7532_003921 [Penicillium argentinense]|uniref:Major facilitator superfamily (MFS) profile domain-containing protein n=1 Tax=Penicillium argentinense TaxID=1131581 RepID=A0A9W9FNF0_9EURO|nr:uncharacterized protein N7532_003921 [Penicillium argentinense]KAJ5103392.1 hypothetical protein N7532_003921 [Penicillium argentinense]
MADVLTNGGEGVQSTRIPIWRLIFDQGCVSQHIIDAKYNGTGTEEDPYQVSWLDDDERNPMKYSEVGKWLIMLLVGVVTMAVALVSSAYSGSINEIILDFHVSEDVSLLGISMFVIGFAVGPLVWAPLSEIYGRRHIMIVNAIGLTAFTAGSAGSKDIWTLIILRIFAGSLGSGPLAVSGGVIADTFPDISRGLASGLYCAAPFLGPTLGPIIGGFLSEASGWRWVEGLLAAFAGVLGIVTIFTLPETYAPVLLQKRAERLSAITGHVYRSKIEIEQGKKHPVTVLKTALCRPWVLLFREPIVLLLSTYLSIIYGILYLMFAAVPIVYQVERGWSEGKTGLAFLGILVGILLSVLATFPQYKRYKKMVLATLPGRVAPEERLPDSYWGAIALPIGLFWFAWTNSPSIHWMASIAAGVPFGFGMVLVFMPVLNYLVDAYTIYAASVLAASSALRSVFGAAFPLFTSVMYENLGIHWASSIPAFLALVCVPIPFLFYRYGPVIRRRCHYAAQSEAFIEKMARKAVSPKEQAGKEETSDVSK